MTKKNLIFSELRHAIAECNSDFVEDSLYCWCYYACDIKNYTSDDNEFDYNSCFVYTSKNFRDGPTKIFFYLNNKVIRLFKVKSIKKLDLEWDKKEIIGLTEDWLKDYLVKLNIEYKQKKELYLLNKAKKDFE